MKGYTAKEEKADSTRLAVSRAEIEREFCTFRPSSFLSVIAKKLPDRSPKWRGAGAMQTSRTSIESALTRASTSWSTLQDDTRWKVRALIRDVK